MKPAPGYCFIIEDTKKDITESGLHVAHKTKEKGSIGTIYEVNGDVICPHCQDSCSMDFFKKGDRVLYSRYVAEFIDYREPDMKEGRLFSLPTDALLAKI